jgi:hypothetical protein
VRSSLSVIQHGYEITCVGVWQYFVRQCVLKRARCGLTHLAVERERGPAVGHALIGARVLRCPHLGEHDTITAVLLVAGPGQGVRRERGPVAP